MMEGYSFDEVIELIKDKEANDEISLHYRFASEKILKEFILFMELNSKIKLPYNLYCLGIHGANKRKKDVSFLDFLEEPEMRNFKPRDKHREALFSREFSDDYLEKPVFYIRFSEIYGTGKYEFSDDGYDMYDKGHYCEGYAYINSGYKHPITKSFQIVFEETNDIHTFNNFLFEVTDLVYSKFIYENSKVFSNTLFRNLDDLLPKLEEKV